MDINSLLNAYGATPQLPLVNGYPAITGEQPSPFLTNDTEGDELVTPQNIDRVQAARGASVSDPFTRGVGAGVRGSLSSAKNFVGAGLEAANFPNAAKSVYDSAAEDAAIAGIVQPPVNKLSHVRGLSDAVQYAAGQMGSFAPMLAIPAGAGAAGALMKMSPAARFGLQTAAFHPLMAGGAVERMRANPETAKLSPQERFAQANLIGGTEGAIMAAPMMRLTGRATGTLADAGRVTMNPIRSGAAEVLGSSAAMGASSAAAGQAGRVHMRQFDPNYETGDDVGKMIEEGTAGAVGSLPFAVPSAVAGHLSDAAALGIDKTKELAAKAPATFDAAKEMFNQATAEKQQAEQAHATAPTPDTQAVVAAATDKANLAYNHVKNAAEATIEAVLPKLGERRGKTAVDNVEHLSDTLLEHYNEKGELPREALDPNVQGALAHTLQEWISSGEVAPNRASSLGRLSAAINEGKELSPSEAMQLFIAAKHIAKGVTVRHSFDNSMTYFAGMQERLGATPPRDAVEADRAKFSRESAGDKINAGTRDAMREAFTKIQVAPETQKALTEAVAARIHKGTTWRGATALARRSVRAALDAAGMSDFGPGSPVYDTLYNGVRDKLSEMIPKKTEDAAEKHTPSAAFDEEVSRITSDMVAGHPDLNDPAMKSLASDSTADFIHNLAYGKEGYKARAARFGEEMRRRFGEKATDAIDQLIQVATLEYGKQAGAPDRLALLAGVERAHADTVRELTPLLGENAKQNVHKFTSEASSAAKRALEADAAFSERESQAKAHELWERASKTQNPVEAKSLREQAKAMASRTPTAAVDALKQRLVEGKFAKDEKSAERLIQLMGGVDKGEPKLAGAHDRSVAEEDTATHDENAPEERVKEYDKFEHEDKPTVAGEEETGTQETVEGDTTYHGAEALTPSESRVNVMEGDKAVAPNRELGAPLSAYPAGDHKGRVQSTELQDAIEHIESQSGFRVANIERQHVTQWAKDNSNGNKPREAMLLAKAMRDLLKKDAERLTADQERKRAHGADAGLTPEDVKAIELRRQMAEQGVSPEVFWKSPWTKHENYLKVTQNKAENLAFTPETLARMSVRHGAFYTHGLERTGMYAARMKARDGDAFPTSTYTNSLMPVKLGSGKHEGAELQVDVPRLIEGTLRRHQQGDVGGVMDKNLADKVLKSFYEIVGAVMDMPEIARDKSGIAFDAIGRTMETTSGMQFDPKLVLFRDAAGKRAWTYGDLTGIVGQHEGMLMKEGVVHMPDGSTHITARSPKNGVLESAVTNAAAKGEGIGSRVLTDSNGKARSLDLRVVLSEMISANGHEGQRALQEGNIPRGYAARMIYQGLERLKSMGYKVDEAKLDGVTLYTEHYGEKEVPVKWGDVKSKSRNTGPVDMEDARQVENRELLLKKRESVGKLIDQLEILKEQTAKMVSAAKGSATRREAELAIAEAKRSLADSEIGEEWSKFGFSDSKKDPYGRVNEAERTTVSAERMNEGEMNSYRLNEILKDAKEEGGGEAPLFDVSTQHLADPDKYRLERMSPEDRESALQEKAIAETAQRINSAKKMQGAINDALNREEIRDAERFGYTEGETHPEQRTSEPPVEQRNPNPEDNSAKPAIEPKPVTVPPITPESRQQHVDTRAEGERITAENAAKQRGGEPRTTQEILNDRLERPVRSIIDEPVEKGAEPVAPAEFSVNNAVREIASMEGRYTPAEAAKFIRSLDPRQREELLRQLSDVNNDAARHLTNVMKNTFGVKDVPFTKEQRAPESDAELATPEARKAYYESIGEKLVGALHLPETEVTDVKGGAGLYEKRTPGQVQTKMTPGIAEKTAKIMVDLAHGDANTYRHELWHHIEELLKEMGDNGKHILDTIHKGVDTPMMRAWLKSELAKSPDALAQLAEPSERAAFAFQKFMENGGKMPLMNEVRGVWQRLWDFVREHLGLTTNQKKTENFFNYIQEQGFARDIQNPEAVLRGMKETTSDQMHRKIAEAVKPLKEAFVGMMTSAETRVRDHANPYYNNLLDAYTGASGKGGYQQLKQAAFTKWANQVVEHYKGQQWNQRVLDDSWGKGFQGQFRNYMEQALKEGYAKQGMNAFEAGATASREIAKLENSVDGYNKMEADQHFNELVNDLISHGGLPEANKAGMAKDIATSIADTGYYYNPDLSLFQGKPAIKEKWLSKDPADKLVAMIHKGTEIAERSRAFGQVTKDAPYGTLFNEQLEAGDKVATPEAREDMKDFIDGWEGKYGRKLSEDMRTLTTGIQFMENVRLLPTAIFSQALEPMQLAFRRNSFDDLLGTLFRGIKDLPRMFDWAEKSYTPDYWENLAMELGTAQSRELHGFVAGLSAGNVMRGRIGWLNDKFFQYNGMDIWNRRMHIEATKHGVEFLKEHARGINAKHSERFLRELGVSATDIKTTPSGELDLRTTDEKTAKPLPPEEQARVRRVESAIVQFVAEAMAHPDAGSNPMWMNDPRFALMSQMKRFTFAHNKYVLARGVREFEKNNSWVMAPAIAAMPWMLAADGLKDTLLMRDTGYKANWGVSDYMMQAFQRAGHAGTGQFGIDVESDVAHGGDGLGAVFGPAAQSFGDVLRSVHKGGGILPVILGTGQFSGGPATE